MYRIREKGCDQLESTSIDFYISHASETALEEAIIWLLDQLSIQNYHVSINDDLTEIYKLVDIVEKENSVANSPLINEWNYDKNTVSPATIARAGSRKVWWKCKEGHEWIQSPSQRRNSPCPYCSGQRILSGYNDLATLYPTIALEWNEDRNKGTDIHSLPPQSNKKFYWLCSNGHEWEATPASRVNGSHCPYCINKKLLVGYNDFATLHPELLLDWDYEANEINPSEIRSNSTQRIQWKCHICNYKWSTKLNQRANGSACPICSHKEQGIRRTIPPKGKSLWDVFPEIAKEWDYDKNEKEPTDFFPKSHFSAYWICPYCGQSYEAVISNRTAGHGCNKCAAINRGKKQRIAPFELSVAHEEELLQDWDYEANDAEPDKVYANSNIRREWICHICGHHWSTSPNNRRKSGCPMCAKKNRRILSLENE